MLSDRTYARLGLGTLFLLWAGIGGCSGAQLTEPPMPDRADADLTANSESSDYGGVLDLPHPMGMDFGDLREIFFSKQAPALESLAQCAAGVEGLFSATAAKAELLRGVRELVRSSPRHYHWCFYGKLLSLVQELKSDHYLDQKQRRMVETYQVLVPIARALMAEVKDSRYLRWAIRSYQRHSEWVFYRRLELSPLGTQEMISVGEDYAVEGKESPAEESVIARYGIPPATPAPAQPEPEKSEVSEEIERTPAEVKDAEGVVEDTQPTIESGTELDPEMEKLPSL